MKKIKTGILLLMVLANLFVAHAQQGSVIRGRVIDKSDKSSIIGANIVEIDNSNRTVNGTNTNLDGYFVLQMKNASNKIVVRVIGYKAQEIKVDPSKSIVVELESSDVQLGEIKIVAEYKSGNSLTNIDDRDNASSTVKVDMMDMKDSGILSAADALQGKVSGLDIISGSGDPGSGSQLVIRGLSSIGNNKPLIVVDGIPQFRVSDGFDLSSASSEDISNLVNIALQDIKSIEVLKDAGSTAIFGSKGADGVLLIETKKGRMGKVQFDYQYKRSLSVQPAAIPMLNGNEYIMLQLEEWHNSKGDFEIPSEIAYDKDYSQFYNYSANTDWISEITQNANTDDHYFSISGGGDKTRFFTSYSYVSEGGTTVNTNSNRFSTRVNLDYFLSRNFLFQIKFNYTTNSTEGNIEVQGRNVREMAYIKAPNMSIWEYDYQGNLTGEYFNPIQSYQGNGIEYFNPVAVANLGSRDTKDNSLNNTFLLQYRINDWLVVRETVSLLNGGSKQKSFLPYNAIGADWLNNNINQAKENNGMSSSFRTETQMSFGSPFKTKIHVISGALTWITEQSKGEWMATETNRSASTDITDPAANAQLNWMGNGSSEQRMLSALSNINYKYQDKYMLQTNFRADAASAFGVNNRWGSFMGVSVGWRFSDEAFLDSWDFLDDSKLRFSWGVAGRQPKDGYARFGKYESTGNGSYITNTAIAPISMQLSDLSWESIASYDIGLELNFFKNRIYLEGDIYQKTTTNILFEDYEIPGISGYSELKYYNGGEMSNVGWELMADAKIVQTKDWLFSINLNTSHNTNSFTRLPDNFNPERSTSIGNGQYPLLVQEGEPIGSFFGFRYLGVYATDADAVAKDKDGNTMYHTDGSPIPLRYLDNYTFKGGDAIYKDLNHDGKIDINDVEKIGDSNPDVFGGFGTNLKYKNFRLSASFFYRMGFDIINGIAIQTEGMIDRNNQSKASLSRWRVQGQSEEGLLPRAYMNNPANNLGSDRYVEEGSFLRLNNLTIAYELNKNLCNKLRIRQANIALSGRKLLTYTKYSGQDPEVGQDASDPFWIGVDEARTPPPKFFTIALGVGF